jgi:hypothetical protein
MIRKRYPGDIHKHGVTLTYYAVLQRSTELPKVVTDSAEM